LYSNFRLCRWRLWILKIQGLWTHKLFSGSSVTIIGPWDKLLKMWKIFYCVMMDKLYQKSVYTESSNVTTKFLNASFWSITLNVALFILISHELKYVQDCVTGTSLSVGQISMYSGNCISFLETTLYIYTVTTHSSTYNSQLYFSYKFNIENTHIHSKVYKFYSQFYIRYFFSISKMASYQSIMNKSYNESKKNVIAH